MKYLMMIYNDEAAATMPREQMTTMMGEYYAYTKETQDKGAYIGGNPLHPTTSATTVRVRDGKKPLTTDGPGFAETKEQMGGYYLLGVQRSRRGHRLGREDPGRENRLHRNSSHPRHVVNPLWGRRFRLPALRS